MPRISVYCASSIDNFIATTDDNLDWLDELVVEGEDYGYHRFMSSIDALALGRGTWDHIAEIDPLPFGERPVFVFTHHESIPARAGVTFWAMSPREAVAEWERRGIEHVYLDGGQLISSFLAAGLVDDLILTKMPILLGSGRPLFLPIDQRTKLALREVERFDSGIVNLHYAKV